MRGRAPWLQGNVQSLLVGDRDLAAVMAAAGRLGAQFETVGTVRGFNYSRGRFVTLSLLRRQPP